MLVAVRATHEHLDLGVLDELTRGAEGLSATIAEVQDASLGPDADPVLDGWVVVSTCNRLEVYLDARRFHDGIDLVVEAITRTSGLSTDLVSLCLETAMGAPVTHHLYEVTAGLRSLVLGEAEIAGQVRSAFESARRAGRTTSLLNDLFQIGFRSAKRVAREAPVGAAGRSGAAIALDRAAEHLGDLHGSTVLVIGTGAYARLTVADLRRRGTDDIRVHSGTGRAPGFAERHGVEAVAPGELEDHLRQADLVIACSGRGTSLFPEQFLGVGPTLVLDLALHSDLHPLLPHLQDLTVLGLEDLALENRDSAEPVVAQALAIIAEGAEQFRSRQEVRRVDPAMTALRGAVDAAAEAELATLRRERPAEIADDVERSVRRILQTVLHSPTVRARRLAEDGHAEEYVEAFHTIFGIDITAAGAGIGSATSAAETAARDASAEVAMPPSGWMRLDRTVPPRWEHIARRIAASTAGEGRTPHA